MPEQDPTATTQPTPQPTSDPREDLRALLDRLVPAEGVEVQDVTGGRHRLPAALPARRQIPVMRALEALRDLPSDVPGVEELATVMAQLVAGKVAPTRLLPALVGALLKLAGHELVLKALADAFALAHPEVARLATEAAQAAHIPVQDVADAFAVEEIVAGLLPFFLRLARRAMEAMETAGLTR